MPNRLLVLINERWKPNVLDSIFNQLSWGIGEDRESSESEKFINAVSTATSSTILEGPILAVSLGFTRQVTFSIT